MKDRPHDAGPPPPDTDDAVVREARRARGWSLADALAARDGGGHLAGASPVSAQQQFALALDQWLAQASFDPERALRRVLVREVAGRPLSSAEVAAGPRAALAARLRVLLAEPALLAEFVREVDAEWGRLHGERPRFDRDGQPPAADDPYPRDGVARSLRDLLARAEDPRTETDDPFA